MTMSFIGFVKIYRKAIISFLNQTLPDLPIHKKKLKNIFFSHIDG